MTLQAASHLDSATTSRLFPAHLNLLGIINMALTVQFFFKIKGKCSLSFVSSGENQRDHVTP